MEYGRVKPWLLIAARPKKTITSSRDLTLDDADYLLIIDSSNPVTLTFPALSWEASTEIEILQWGTGAVTLTPGAGVVFTRFGSPGTHVLAGRASGAIAVMIGANDWWLEGRFV
jgi:hypothetical protein